MHDLRFAAPAKVNLFLTVHGRRADGFHQLTSAVVFASEIADQVCLRPGAPIGVRFSGPIGTALKPGNDTLSRALRILGDTCPDLRLGAVSVEKQIPLASGLGGGSADAAALLRAVQSANPNFQNSVDWIAVGRQIGADVPVCLRATAQAMTGTGETIVPLASFPEIHAVLIKPETVEMTDKTKKVFSALGAPEVNMTDVKRRSEALPRLSSADDVAQLVRRYGNDLHGPAFALMPEIAVPLDALNSLPRCLAAGLSGAGPTVFGLFKTRPEAQEAARKITRSGPSTWWVRTSALV